MSNSLYETLFLKIHYMTSDLGETINGMQGIQPNTINSILDTIKKIFSKERLLYLTIGVILLVCIYYYLQLKKSKKEEKNEQDIYLKQDKNSQYIRDIEDFSESNKMLDIESNQDKLHSFQTPEGFITIPVDTYNELQDGYQKAISNENMDNSSDNYKMENNLSVSDQDEDIVDKSLEHSNNSKQSSEEDSRVKEQDLTNTEIQSIQHQLNSFK